MTNREMIDRRKISVRINESNAKNAHKLSVDAERVKNTDIFTIKAEKNNCPAKYIDTKYIDDLSMPNCLKIAKNFSVQYFGNCVPKNAIYGRLSKYVYMYVDNYAQFNNPKVRLFNVKVLDSRKDSRFKDGMIKKGTTIYNMVMALIDSYDLYDTVCIYPLKMNSDKKPESRRIGEYVYKSSPRQLLSGKAADHGRGITETDACRTFYQSTMPKYKDSKRYIDSDIYTAGDKLRLKYEIMRLNAKNA